MSFFLLKRNFCFPAFGLFSNRTSAWLTSTSGTSKTRGTRVTRSRGSSSSTSRPSWNRSTRADQRQNRHPRMLGRDHEASPHRRTITTSVTEVDRQLTDTIAMTIHHHITITTENTSRGHVEVEGAMTGEVITQLRAEVVMIMEATLKVEAASGTNFQIISHILLLRTILWQQGLRFSRVKATKSKSVQQTSL